MVILVTIVTTIPIIATRFPTKYWNAALVLLPLHAVTCQSHFRKLKTKNFHSPSKTQIYALHEGIRRSRELLLGFPLTLEGVARLHSRPNRFTVSKTIPGAHLVAD